MKKMALAPLLALAFAAHVDAKPAKGALIFDAFDRICLQATGTEQSRAAVLALGGVAAPPSSAGVPPEQPLDYDLELGGAAAHVDIGSECALSTSDVELPVLLEAFDANIAQRTDAEVLSPTWVHPVMRTEREVRLGVAGSETATRLRVLGYESGSGRTQAIITRFIEKGSNDPTTAALAEVPPSENPEGRRAFPPRYPMGAVRACAFGTVRLRVTIDATGKVVNILTARSSLNRELDNAAIAAARQWQYTPGLKDGQPVGGDVIVPITFVNPCPGKKK